MQIYKLHTLELSEYSYIPSQYSKLEVNLYIDECASYKRWNHRLWMIASKGDPYYDSWIAISISSTPQLLFINNNNDSLPISHKCINKCIEFVRKFYTILRDIANEHVDSDVIFDLLETNQWSFSNPLDIEKCYDALKSEFLLAEEDKSYQPLSEMAILRSDVTGIKPSIWIEQASRTTEHNIERIKFQTSSDTKSTSFFPILLKPDGAEISDKNPCPAPTKIQREVIEFVNKYRKIIEAFIEHKFDDQRLLKKLIKSGQTEWPVPNDILKSLEKNEA